MLPTQLPLPELWGVVDLAQPVQTNSKKKKKINGAAARQHSPGQELSRERATVPSVTAVPAQLPRLLDSLARPAQESWRQLTG